MYRAGDFLYGILKQFTREEHVSVFPFQASQNLKTARCPMIFDISRLTVTISREDTDGGESYYRRARCSYPLQRTWSKT